MGELYLLNDTLEVWDNGEAVRGTVYSARKTMFGKIIYTVAVVVPNGFDPEGILKEKYKYLYLQANQIIRRVA